MALGPSETLSALDAELPFRQVAQDLPTPCWISDSEGRITWVNAAWIAYTGMDVPAIEAEGLERLHDPEMYQQVRERWVAAKQLGQPVEMRFPLRGRDGVLRPFHTRVVPLRDPSGAVTRWFGTNTDISAQSNAEAMLRESQTRLELATAAAQLGVWDWNLTDNSFVYSPRAREICGLPRDGEVTFEDVVRVTHPEDYPRTSAMAKLALDPEKRSVTPYRYRVLRPDGEVRWVEAYGHALFKGAGKEARAVRYVGTLQDITEVTRLQEAARETGAILKSLFDASELFIAVLEVTDDSFLYVVANRATAAFYNQPLDTPFDARDIGIPADELKQWRKTLLEVSASGSPRTMEYAFDGGRGEGWYIGTYTPLPAGPSGRPRVSFVVIDVTARKRAEQHQALLLKEVDHRAKNALAVAQAIVQLTSAESAAEFKRSVQGRIAALARVHTLLALERWTGASLRRLIEEELAPFVTDRPSRVSLTGPDHALTPEAAQSIGLVVHELATNAAKHGALSVPAGDVQVSWITDESGTLTIVWREISDREVGAADRRGFGFTLLQQTIVHQLGGQWSVERPGTGIIFRISLPRKGAAAPSRSTPQAAGGRRRVLIVEDEPLLALALEEDVVAEGLVVAGSAATLPEARRLADDAGFELAILDLNLGGASTVDLAIKLRASGVKVVFCTGYQAPDLPDQLRGIEILRKPIDREALGRALQS